MVDRGLIRHLSCNILIRISRMIWVKCFSASAPQVDVSPLSTSHSFDCLSYEIEDLLLSEGLDRYRYGGEEIL